MDMDRIIDIGTFILTSLVSISTISLQRQQKKALKRGKRPSSLPSTKRKKKVRK